MREYPTHPVAAVSGVLLDDKQRVLLIRRAMPPARNLWSCPGGVIRLGESPADALTREFLEETGLEVSPAGLLDVSHVLIRDEEGRIQFNYILVHYLARLISGTLKAGSDAADAEWFPVDEIDRIDSAPGLRNVLWKAVRFRKHQDKEGTE